MSLHFNFRMKTFKPHDVVCLFVVFCQCAFHVKSIPCRGTASYQLQFQAEWKNTSSRPAGAGFSGFIGCSHNKCYRMWREGEKASLGVRNVAEKGDGKVLEYEINKLVGNRTTFTAFTRSMHIAPLGTANVVEFNVDSIRPLVSVIAKIITFSHWFIGVHDLDLCDRNSGHWFGFKQVKPVYAYDAHGISRIYSHAPWTSQEQQLGVFHFSKMQNFGETTTGKFESDESVTCPDKASRSNIPCVIVCLISLLVTLTQ